jgi:RNA polymerase sigma factor (sigma-70 family)
VLPEVNGAQAENQTQQELISVYEAHSQGLLSYASSLLRSREDAVDILQEAFLRFFVERSYGRQIENPRAWLYRVVRNLSLDWLERAAFRRDLGETNPEMLAGTGDSPETMLRRKEMAGEIASLLTEGEFQCVVLRAQGLSYEEMADVLHLSAGTVASFLGRVHKKLQKATKGQAALRQEAAQALALQFRSEPSPSA